MEENILWKHQGLALADDGSEVQDGSAEKEVVAREMKAFDAARNGSGTKEWAEVTENICRGCAHNCRYCYAAHGANRFKRRDRSEWKREELTKRAAMTSYPAREGVVMFPSSHDITPFNLKEYVRVAKLILAKGNRLLVVSKPHFDCVREMLTELEPWLDSILFRFTIGTTGGLTSQFWEPGAPLPEERLACLKMAWDTGAQTSVSIEPMLEGRIGALDVVSKCQDLVTDTIWIGKMNKIRQRIDMTDPFVERQVKCIETLQTDCEILDLYSALKDNSKIRWKDSIKQVLAQSGISTVDSES